MKRVLILSEAKPVQGGKAENTIFGYLSKFILSKNYDLDFYFLDLKNNLNDSINKKKIFNFLKKKNFKLKKKKIYLKKNFFSPFKLFFPTIDTSLKFNFKNIRINNNTSYDLLISLGHCSFYLSRQFKFKKRIFIMGDPPGERLYVYSKINFKNKKDINNFFKLFYSYVCFKLENYYWKWNIDFKNTVIGIFGTATAKRFRNIFKKKLVVDLRPAMPKLNNRSIYYKKNITKIILAGSLGGSFAKSTLANFINLINSFNYPFLKYYLLGHEIEKSISSKLVSNLNNLHLLPATNNFENILSRMNIFIIPTEYYIGVRTRLCSALSAGNFCIITKAVLLNMPELNYCKSVEVVNFNNKEILRSIVKYHNLSYGKKLQLNYESKEFFRNNYLYSVSAKKFISQII
jgi:hypothetical protein